MECQRSIQLGLQFWGKRRLKFAIEESIILNIIKGSNREQIEILWRGQNLGLENLAERLMFVRKCRIVLKEI